MSHQRENETPDGKQQEAKNPGTSAEKTGPAEFAALASELSDPFRPGMAGRRTDMQRAIQLRRRYGAEGFRRMLRNAWTQRKAKRQAAGLDSTVTSTISQAAPQSATPAAPAHARRPGVLRAGSMIPNGVKVQKVDLKPDSIVSLAYDAGYASAGGFANDANFHDQIGNKCIQAFGSLARKTTGDTFTETQGLNMNWTWSVTLTKGTPSLVQAGGVSQVEAHVGGSAETSQKNSESKEESQKVTTGVEAEDEGVKGSASSEASQKTTTSKDTTTTDKSDQSATLKVNQGAEIYQADLIASVTVSGEPDFSGTDYINPFKWGSAATTEVLVNGPKTKEGPVGTFQYMDTSGFAPAQKKSWLEVELGRPVLSDDDAKKVEGMSQTDPRTFSREGARPLPPQLATAAQEHHGASLEGVRLVQGAQADAYCDQMDAAAFCTPSSEGASDIYVHSDVSLESPEGQHTVQHEIAHAVQNQQGQTQTLDGLGGDPVARDQLEKAADSHADEILASSTERKQAETPRP